ncbi:MAG: cyclic 2,3-diphosphoglycerate synthase [Acetobacteraceae bacterium]|nr:cyclic 2,3-diphosphoglycerate synthase [Acetobacteraceae bacterium]
MPEPRRIIIMGAAGRDFHNFNVAYRGRPEYRVEAFTAAQIPDIEGRVYPPELAGPGYPDGIPIRPESELRDLIRDRRVDEVVFAYSDVSHEHVMHRASLALSAGADFRLLGPKATMLRSRRPVVSVCAVRTGAGKSQTSRRVAEILAGMGLSPVAVRHPMPYGDLSRQACMRFAAFDDLDRHRCTVEEREEFEPHLERGTVVYAGVDYARILEAAEAEGDVILWDGGNNDLPFFWPDVHIVVADPHRAGDERRYHPGEANLLLADVVVINKVDTARPEWVEAVRASIAELNPAAVVVEAASPIALEWAGDGRFGRRQGEPVEFGEIRGRGVLVVEDGPTLTHGEMAYGAGVVAAKRAGASLVDPRPHAVGSLVEVFSRFRHLGTLLPAMGYGPRQIKELEETINATPADLVLSATPVDLGRILRLNKPAVRARYRLEEVGQPDLAGALRALEGRLRRDRAAPARSRAPRRPPARVPPVALDRAGEDRDQPWGKE